MQVSKDHAMALEHLKRLIAIADKLNSLPTAEECSRLIIDRMLLEKSARTFLKDLEEKIK